VLGFVCTLIFYFSTIGNLLLLHFTVVRSKLECALPVYNNITATDAIKLGGIQRKFAALYFTRFSPHIPCNYACALELLNLHTLQVRMFHFEALFFIRVLFMIQILSFFDF